MSWLTPWGPFGWPQNPTRSLVFSPQQDEWLAIPSPSGTPPPDTQLSPRELPTSLILAVQQKTTIKNKTQLFPLKNHSNDLRFMNTKEKR